MKLELVPLLQTQRDLYDLPRGGERFRRYLEVMIGDTDDIALPLPAMNPMGKEHGAATYDGLLALDAEASAAEAVAWAAERLRQVPGEFRVALVVADDAGGGWTNRYMTEFSYRFDFGQGLLKRGWLVVLLWSSAPTTAEQIRAETLLAIYRVAHRHQFGQPKTLRQMLEQESRAAAFAQTQQPSLPPDDLAYTHEVIQPYLESTDFPTIFACLFGDEAARSVGYPALGLSERAGLALAVAEAEQYPEPAEILWVESGR